MTVWTAIVAPICLMAKCALDFMGLEYGSRYQAVTDDQFLFGCVVFCGCAVIADLVNFSRNKRYRSLR